MGRLRIASILRACDHYHKLRKRLLAAHSTRLQTTSATVGSLVHRRVPGGGASSLDADETGRAQTRREPRVWARSSRIGHGLCRLEPLDWTWLPPERSRAAQQRQLGGGLSRRGATSGA